ncbi:MAG: hypothetical protein H0U95_18540 [Bacteroidetes bacterium]|nr:hypothetical protein [Bacteroidota bacterium]
MSNCNYSWFKFRMYVACLKCGTKIPLQSLEGAPHCNDCGETSESSWEELCSIADIKDLRKGNGSNKSVYAVMQIALNTEPIDEIACYHCKNKIDLHEDLIQQKSCDCPSCNEKLNFETISSYNDFTFYRYINQKMDPAQLKTVIAVHCAACGAPMKKDPGKINYHCDFCGVENILPIALRQKRVLDDIFAGVQEKIILPEKLLEVNELQKIIACLKGNKKEAFAANSLNTVMLKFPDNLQVYHIIVNDLKHTFPNEVFEKLWETSKSAVFLKIIGQKLNKSESEITKRIKKFDKNYKQQEQTSKKEEKGFFDSLKKIFE